MLGKKNKQKKTDNQDVKALSETRQRIRKQMEQCKNQNKIKELRKERKRLMKSINKTLKEIEETEVEILLKDIEEKKDDSNKCYEAITTLKRRKLKKPLLIKNQETGYIAGTPKEQADIITRHFSNMLAPDSFKNNFISYKPCEMTTPFNSEEIEEAAHRLKNNKSTGIDEIKAELIKYAPTNVFKMIADIYNTTAKTGEHPEEITLGILTPLQKPGKPKGPPENLRPIILLSMLRKILTICLLKRIWARLKTKIPPNQAAYQPGRSTTEQVFAIKILCEKAIISNDYKLHLLLLDMSKAFDTVKRDTLMKNLETILKPDVLHILSILTNKPALKVRVDKEHGEAFQTSLGIMQGDCLSAVLFILYLAQCLNEDCENNRPLKYDLTTNDNNTFNVDPFYADDTTFAGTNEEGKNRLNDIEHKAPEQLKIYNLKSNESKKEKYEVPRPPAPKPPLPTLEELEEASKDKIIWSELDYITNYKPKETVNPHPDWRKCKLLGSLLGTQEDIERRKHLVTENMKNLKDLFNSKHISITLKLRLFTAFITPIMLYNSELWALTETLQNKIDALQRRQLRNILQIKWPETITNQILYILTEMEPWTTTIKRRRLAWTGHLARMDTLTPARRSLEEALKPIKRKQGRPPHTWLTQFKRDIISTKIIKTTPEDTTKTIFTRLEQTAQNRKLYRRKVDCCIPKPRCPRRRRQ